MLSKDRNLADIHLALSRDQAWALAELCKRAAWSDLRQLAAGDDEADQMQAGLIVLARELSAAGFSPR
jgi:hypothetical protein